MNPAGTDKNLASAWISEIWSLHKYMFYMIVKSETKS